MDLRNEVGKWLADNFPLGCGCPTCKKDIGKRRATQLLALIAHEQGPIEAEWFKKGQMSIKRKNQSGCICVIEDDDTISHVCDAHRQWAADSQGLEVEKECPDYDHDGDTVNCFRASECEKVARCNGSGTIRTQLTEPVDVGRLVEAMRECLHGHCASCDDCHIDRALNHEGGRLVVKEDRT